MNTPTNANNPEFVSKEEMARRSERHWFTEPKQPEVKHPVGGGGARSSKSLALIASATMWPVDMADIKN